MKSSHISTFAIINILFFSLASFANVKTSITDWPTKSLSQAGFDTKAFGDFENYAFDNEAGYKTDSIVIIKDGHLVYERYANGYGPNDSHMLWSFSKSLVNALIGVAIQKGVFPEGLETKVQDYFPEIKRKEGEEIRLKHLMQMTSGLDYYEEHPGSILKSNSISMNYTVSGYKDIAKYVAKLRSKYKPGEKFNYSSGDCNLAIAVLQKRLSQLQIDPLRFPWVELFDKLGMKSTYFETDFNNQFVGGSFGWSSALDIARLAQLYLNDGKLGNERVFPQGWVEKSLEISPPLLLETVQANQMRLNQEAYGLYWWLNKKLPMNKSVPYPGTPEDAYLAMGYRGQTLTIIPSMNLIVVRLATDGLDPKNKINRAKFLKLLVNSLTPVDPDILKDDSSHEEAYGLNGLLGFFSTGWSLISHVVIQNLGLDDGITMSPAKDLCSCKYVSQQSENSCLANHEQYQQFLEIGFINGWIRPAEFDDQKKSVTLRNDWQRTTAQYMGPNIGCKIISVKSTLRGELLNRKSNGSTSKY
jgi:CubicO group peptidase (beta-lactamase class C family)